MKVLALVYAGMTLLDLVGPLPAWSFLPGYAAAVWDRPSDLTDAETLAAARALMHQAMTVRPHKRVCRPNALSSGPATSSSA